MRRLERRRGVVLPVALAIVTVLGLATLAVFVMRQATYKSLSFIDSYLGAVSVGEAAYTDVVARLQRQAWEERWFKGTRQSGEKSWGPGRYEFLVADADVEREADLVVWAKVKDVEVSMYWRLRAQPQTLLPYRRIRTVIFTHLPTGTRATPGALTDILPGIRTAIDRRKVNEAWVERTSGQLVRDRGPGPVGTVLGVPPGGTVDGEIPGTGTSGPPVPVAPRVTAGTDAQPPPAPVFPRPTGGRQPAEPGTMRQLAGTRRRLSDSLSTAKKALDAFGMTIERNLGNVRAQLANDCAAGNVAACSCKNDADAVSASAAAVKGRIEDCVRKIQNMQDRIDAAANVPGPTQEQAEQLVNEAEAVVDCGNGTCTDVQDVARSANAALAPCGQSVASFPTGPGAVTTCGMNAGP